MNYKSGVYSYTSGKELGGHGVLLVGYNDAGQYFIVKNSWGPGWGEDGFFRIAYSELKSVCNFGLSTIAYTPAQSSNSGDYSAASKATEQHVDSDSTIKQLTPLMQQKP
jgi:C1A family cysteine protease